MEDLILEPKRSDDEYFYYDWPVIGDVAIPKATVEKNKDNPAELNRGVVEAYAEWLTDKDIDLSSLDAFTNTFGREFTSTSRGIMETGDGERTTTYEDELINELYATMNSGAWWSGLITGALADPVTIPTTVLKLFKLGLVGQGVATGGVGGFLQPDRPEWGTSQVGNTVAGAAAGGVLGAIFGKIYKALGVGSPEEAQRVFDEGGEQVKELIQKEAKDVSETFLETEAKTTAQQAAQQIDQRQARADFENNLASQRAATDEMLARQYNQDYNNNLARIQNEATQRVSDDFNAVLQRNQIEAQQQAFLNNIQAANQRANVTDVERDSLIRELSARVQSAGKTDSVADASAAVKMIKSQLDSNRQSLKRISEGARTRQSEDVLLARRVFLNDNLEKAQAKLEASKKVARDAEDLAKLKAGRDIPELTQRVDTALAKMTELRKRPIPEVRPPEAPRNIRSVEERQQPPVPTPVPMQNGMPVPQFQPVQRAPVQAPTPTPTQSVVQQAFNGLGGKASTAMPRSGGAAQVNPLAMPSGAQQAATMNTQTRAAQSLPDTTLRSEGEALDAGLSRAEQVRRNAIRADSQEQVELLRPDGFTGKSYDFEQMLRNADELGDQVLDDINSGNFVSASQWMMDRLVDTDGNMTRLPTQAESLIMARIAGVAESRLRKLQSVQRQLTRDGDLSDKSVRVLAEMQVNKTLSEEMNEMANIVTMREATNSEFGRRLVSMKLANEQYVATMQKIARGDFVEQLFFGVDC